jgi:hypothetical protein
MRMSLDELMSTFREDFAQIKLAMSGSTWICCQQKWNSCSSCDTVRYSLKLIQRKIRDL